jgi:PAS domain S-box-containing protein
MAEEELYRVIFGAADVALVLIKDERFIEANSKAGTLLGCDREELFSQSPLKFSPPRQPNGRSSAELIQERLSAALNGQRQRFAWRFQPGPDMAFEAMVTLQRLPGADQTILLASIIDLAGSRQRAAEDEQRLAELERRVRRERIIHEITAKLGAAASLDVLLETAARELGQQLRAPIVLLELGVETPRGSRDDAGWRSLAEYDDAQKP